LNRSIKLTSGGLAGGGGGGGGGGGAVTVSRALACVEPPGPLALSVYVVESVGETERVPCASTRPIPGSIVTSVEFCVLQRSVALWPRCTLDGSTVRLAVGAGAGGGGGGGGVGGGWRRQALENASVSARVAKPRYLVCLLFISFLQEWNLFYDCSPS
jgi:hypothetical protein